MAIRRNPIKFDPRIGKNSVKTLNCQHKNRTEEQQKYKVEKEIVKFRDGGLYIHKTPWTKTWNLNATSFRFYPVLHKLVKNLSLLYIIVQQDAKFLGFCGISLHCLDRWTIQLETTLITDIAWLCQHSDT